jgi:hypothetical protein
METTTPVTIAVGLVMMAASVWVAGNIVGLKQRPQWRALWTALPAYVVAMFVAWDDSKYSNWAVLVALLPGALLLHALLFFSYRKAWMEDDNIPEGAKLANTDWKIGLIPIGVVALWFIAGVAGRIARELMG